MGHGFSLPRDPKVAAELERASEAATAMNNVHRPGRKLSSNYDSLRPGKNTPPPANDPQRQPELILANEHNGSGSQGTFAVGEANRFPPLLSRQVLPQPHGRAKNDVERCMDGTSRVNHGETHMEGERGRRRREKGNGGWISTRRSTGTIRALMRTDLTTV